MSTAAAINHVVNSYGSVVATNCVFAVNRSAPGVDFRAGSAVSGGTYLGCKFIRNYGATRGGGVCYPNTQTTKAGTFVGCYFERNGSGALRGNVYATNCVFVGNTGGSAACTDCKAVVGCAFTNNVSSGSGTVSAASECPVVDCDFYGNEAQCGGGTAGAGIRAVNCLITGNTATANNQPLATAGVFVNCTVVGNMASNTAAIKGGTATNSVFHGNSPTDIGGGTFVHCVYGTKTGGTFDEASVQAADPKFNRGHYPERAFYSPRVFSPLKDAGIEVGIFDANSLDLDGLPRLNGAIDIGCYEYWSIIQPTQIILQ